MKPDLYKRVEQGQERQKAACIQRAAIHNIKIHVGSSMYAQNFRLGVMWQQDYVAK